MRLAFSTLGIPGLPVSDAVQLAADNGFDGLELRAHPEEPVHPGLTLAERVDVVEEFKAAGVEILTVAGYAKVAAPGDDDAVVAEVRALLELARDLGASYVRVFPGGGDSSSREEGDATAARRLAALAPFAADLGVRVLLETHDSHSTGEDVARVLAAVGHASAGALWDVMHTWRAGEDPGESQRLLAPFLGYVQVKDIASADDTTPLAPGRGVLPLRRVVELLTHAGAANDPIGAVGTAGSVAAGARADTARGWLCWEYEKRWYPEIPELPELLPGVRDHLRSLLSGS
ncbi:sugar phosphate isomerase/epimerase family protein [Streptomyces albidus (ex Kaewkla and Franco 2022)]|uniref:sugar phosphate isomerase/epimerase family protein n=1 Tax=Streptomyces albidus (ex Kaewkla and Franco 2022) TaxID=722709 RepID=UPI0015EFA4A8|nr:sugar phosphate isomerase/epimerase family protein [Streptomyces albidus (ex Kaewkla and Franco 2022)]